MADYRLPTDVRPTHYDLTLAPSLTDFTFRGEESIALEVARPTSRIIVNTAEVAVQSARLNLAAGGSVAASRIETDEDAETTTFSFDRSLPTGPATLHLQFTGILNDQLRGFYRSRYTGADGQQGFLVTTQFEATDARRAFPCWDEPAVKATFRVTLVVPSELAAISNTPVESETPLGNGTKAVRFAESPKMSTYLLAFLVGDFASVEATAANGTMMRVWATRGREEPGRSALAKAVRWGSV